MPMVAVDVMTKAPSRCMACREGTNDEGPKPAIDLNIDYDFGSNGYICEECGHLIATLLGYIDLDKVKKLTRKVREQKQDLDLARAELEKANEQLELIRAGSKAVKEVRA